jgi:hypothetical protein
MMFPRLLVCLILLILLSPLSASAMEPLGEAEMGKVHGRSGIAIMATNATIYAERGKWGYEDTTNASNRIRFADSTSYSRFNSLEPLTLRILENGGGLTLVALEALAGDGESAWDMRLSHNSTDYDFAGQDLGSMHLEGMSSEEFALYATPSEALDGVDRNGIALQLETRTAVQELLWSYQTGDSNTDAFRLGGIHLAGSFENGEPQGLFSVGELDPYDESGVALDPAVIQVRQDDQGQAFVRMSLPMEGSMRVKDVEVGIHDNLGPIRVDGMDVHHLQLDFKPSQE